MPGLEVNVSASEAIPDLSVVVTGLSITVSSETLQYTLTPPASASPARTRTRNGAIVARRYRSVGLRYPSGPFEL